MDNLYTVIITAIATLGGTSAFRYYEKRSVRKDKEDDFMRIDCRDRIAKLEALLIQSSKEKDEMRALILQLTAQVAELRVKVEFLSEENDKLAKEQKKKILNG
jgi:hypothetical protein